MQEIFRKEKASQPGRIVAPTGISLSLANAKYSVCMMRKPKNADWHRDEDE